MRLGLYYPDLDALPAIAEAGFDFVLIDSLRQNVDAFLNNPYGIKIAISVIGNEDFILLYPTHPNIEAWYINDEPSTGLHVLFLATLMQRYRPVTPYPMFWANLPWPHPWLESREI